MCWTPSSTFVTPRSSIRSICSCRHQSGRVSNVMATYRIADCSFSASTVGTSRASAPGTPRGRCSSPRCSGRQTIPGHSTGRAVIVPPITISSTLSTRWPRISNCSSRACTCPERVVAVLPRPLCRGLLSRVTLGGMERVVRPARAGQALPVRAGRWRGHHRDRCYTRERAGRLDHQDLPEGLPFPRSQQPQGSRSSWVPRAGNTSGRPQSWRQQSHRHRGAWRGCGRSSPATPWPHPYTINVRLQL